MYNRILTKYIIIGYINYSYTRNLKDLTNTSRQVLLFCQKGGQFMAFSLHGVHVPHRKKTITKAVAHMPSPATVTIPMLMHIGTPATPIVKVGDTVFVGTKIGEETGNISSPVFSSVSGKVAKIIDLVMVDGKTAPAVVIQSDGEMTPDPAVKPPVIQSREDFIDAVKESGVVGLGGAGFPTHVKLNVDPTRIEYLIINGAECEPYVTSDTVTMTTRTADMQVALEALHRFLGIQNVIIGIEANKPDAIAAMKTLAVDGCEIKVQVLPSVYPQGGEKVLIYHTTGRQVPTGKLPIDVGCVMLNCTTLATIGSYLKTGMPLVEKCVTVAGRAVVNPQNVIIPIGTTIADAFEFCEGFKIDPAKVIYGGPMMGITAPDTSMPIMKNTNAVLALTKKEAWLPKTTACIRCGACTNTCPFGLAPAAIAKAFREKDVAALEGLSVKTCMECGCCSFTCPANRPLVQTNKLAKAFLREQQAKEASEK